MLSDVIYENAVDEAEAERAERRRSRRRRQERRGWCARQSPQRRCVYICLGAVFCVLFGLMVAIVTLQVFYHSADNDGSVLVTDQQNASYSIEPPGSTMVTQKPTKAYVTVYTTPRATLPRVDDHNNDIQDEPQNGPWPGSTTVFHQAPTRPVWQHNTSKKPMPMPMPSQMSGRTVTAPRLITGASSSSTSTQKPQGTVAPRRVTTPNTTISYRVPARPRGGNGPPGRPAQQRPQGPAGPPGSGPHGASGPIFAGGSQAQRPPQRPGGTQRTPMDDRRSFGTVIPTGAAESQGSPALPPAVASVDDGSHSRKTPSPRGRMAQPGSGHDMAPIPGVIFDASTSSTVRTVTKFTPRLTTFVPTPPRRTAMRITTAHVEMRQTTLSSFHNLPPVHPQYPHPSHGPGKDERPPGSRPPHNKPGEKPPGPLPPDRPPPLDGGPRPPHENKKPPPPKCKPGFKPSPPWEQKDLKKEPPKDHPYKDCIPVPIKKYRDRIKDIMLYLLMSLFGLGVIMVIITIVSVKVIDARKRGGCLCCGVTCCSCCNKQDDSSEDSHRGRSRGNSAQVQIEIGMNDLQRSVSSDSSSSEGSQGHSRTSQRQRQSEFTVHSVQRLAVGLSRGQNRANHERTYSVETNISDPPSYNEAVGLGGVPGMVVQSISATLPGQEIVVYQPPSYEDVISSGHSLP